MNRQTFLAGRVRVSAAIGILVLLPAFLYGQQVDVDDDDSLEIVVTATRIERAADAVPASVRVIDRAAIEASGAADLIELLPRVPGITVSSASGAIQNSGVRMAGYGLSQVLVLVDGVPVNRPDNSGVDWIGIPLDTVERIEVLRGPASAQYGDGAVAGVINVITEERPPSDRRFTIEARASVDTLLSNRQSLTLGAGGDVIDGRLSVLRVQELPSRESSDLDTLGVQGRVRTRIGDELSVSTKGRYSRSTYELPGALTREQFEENPDQVQGDGDGEAGLEQFDVSTTPAWTGDRAAVRLPIAYRWSRSQEDLFLHFGTPPKDRTVTAIDIRPEGSIELFGSESRIVPTIVLGTDLRRQQLSLIEFADTDRDEITFESEMVRLSAAPWIRLDSRIDERITVDAGVRYELARISGSSDDADDFDAETEFSPLIYDVGVAWHPVDSLRFDARYARVFRFPNFDNQAFYETGLNPPAFFGDLEPELGHHMTAGVEVSVPVPAGEVDVAVNPYALFMNDEIGDVFDADTFESFNANLDDTRRLGGSVEAGYRSDRVDVSVGYSYSRAEFVSGEHEGNRIPRVPEHSGTGEATVRLPAQLAISSDVEASGAFYQDEANQQDPVPGRLDWGGRISWEPEFVEGLRLHIAGKNLLDDRTPTFTFGDTAWYPMPGRRFELGARWRM